MVLGMSGRHGDTRRSSQNRRDKGDNQSNSQQATPVPPSLKHKVPSAEQVHIARLLSDSHTPDDIQERIAEVLTVVSEPEEAVLIALHDHDYNVHKTCEALLDSSSSIQDQWMSIGAGKKSKRKQIDTTETRQEDGRGRRGFNKPDEQEKPKEKPKGQRGNRGGGGGQGGAKGSKQMSKSGQQEQRKDDYRRGDDIRRSDGDYRRKDRGDNYRGRGRYKDRTSNSKPRRSDKLTPDDVPSGNMTEETMPINIVAEEDWGEETTMEEWVVVDHPVVDDPLFPDALATSGTGSETHSTTCSEQRQHTFISEPSATPTNPLHSKRKRRFRSSQIPSDPVEMPASVDILTLELTRLDINFVGTNVFGTAKEALLPTEQPLDGSTIQQDLSAVDPTLSGDTSHGAIIGYKDVHPPPGLTHPSHLVSEKASALLPDPLPMGVPSTTGSPLPIGLPSTTGSTLPLGGPSTTGSTLPLGGPSTTGSTLPLGIPSTTGSSLPLGVPSTTGSTLPLGVPSTTGSTLPLGVPSTTGSTLPLGVPSTTGSTLPLGVPNTTGSTLALGVPSTAANLPLGVPSTTGTSSSVDSFGLPPSINNLSQPVVDTPTINASSTQSLFSSGSSSGHMPTGHTTASHTPSGHAHTGHTSISSTAGSRGGSHTSATGGQSNKVHNNVHPMAPGMVYPPHMLHPFHQYSTHMMMPTYPYDVDTMNRYPGFYGQHATTQDQGSLPSNITGSGSGLSRDHHTTTSSFANESSSGSHSNKYNASNDISSSLTPSTNPSQQGTVQPNQMNPFYNPYTNVLYTAMYGHPLNMAATAAGYSQQTMGPKPGGASNYPVGSSYQQSPAQYLNYDDEQYKGYASSALGKTNTVPSTSVATDLGYSKHQYESKGGGAYTNYVPPPGPVTGYMMPPVPMPHHPLMTTPHDVSMSRSKHAKYQTAGWNNSAHTN